MTNSVVMIVPASHRAALNQLGEALGYGPNNWSIPLSASGSAPATHFGTHTWEQVGGQFHQFRLAVQAGQTPSGMEAYSVALRSLLIRAVIDSFESLDNWSAALADATLVEVTE